MVLTFNAFKFKLFDLKYQRLYDVGLQRSRRVETLEYVTIELNSFLFGCFIQCYLQKIRLYSVVFDFYHNK